VPLAGGGGALAGRRVTRGEETRRARRPAGGRAGERPARGGETPATPPTHTAWWGRPAPRETARTDGGPRTDHPRTGGRAPAERAAPPRAAAPRATGGPRDRARGGETRREERGSGTLEVRPRCPGHTRETRPESGKPGPRWVEASEGGREGGRAAGGPRRPPFSSISPRPTPDTRTRATARARLRRAGTGTATDAETEDADDDDDPPPRGPGFVR
jgi:hypothetical protein